MALNIESDYGRFRRIVRGKIRENLRKYMTHGELIGKKGKDVVSIPLPQIEIPRFRFSPKQQGGVGQGEGEEGSPLAPGEGEAGGRKAGNAPGQHILEVEMKIEELAEILGEELQLPRIQPKGKHKIESLRTRYTSISRTGPETLRHFKRTYREALKRQIACGSYDWESPVIIPVKEDVRYRSGRPQKLLMSNAVIFYIMDVSGSMGDEQKEIVRIESFWIDAWLRVHYPGLETRYIVHDAEAHEVNREQFFTIRESGGTMISSAYRLLHEIVAREYSPEEWNVYGFQFSDGENWGDEDNSLCVSLLRDEILPKLNLFCYGQVSSHYGDGDYIKVLEQGLPGFDNVALSRIENKDAIYDSIREFLGKGK